MTLISIITPVYNAERYIAFAIDSVVKQTYPGWELIIVDDGSTDSSFSVIEPYLIDPRIRYLKKANGGQASARNLGLQHAKGQLIAFLDADDEWLENKLLLQVQYLENNPAVDVLFAKAHVFDSHGAVDPTKKLDPPAGVFTGRTGFYDLAFGRFFIPILTVLAKREAIARVGGFYESREIQNAEDFDLWARMLLNGAWITCIDSYLAFYRTHPTQRTASDQAATVQVIRALQRIKVDHPEIALLASISILNRILQNTKEASYKHLFLSIYSKSVNLTRFAFRLIGFRNYVKLIIKILLVKKALNDHGI